MKAVAELEGCFANVRGEFTLSGRFGIGSSHERRVASRVEFTHSGGMAKVVGRSAPQPVAGEREHARNRVDAPLELVNDPFKEVVLIYNGIYAFKLERLSAGKPNTLAYLGEDPKPVRRSLDRVLAATCDSSTTAGGVPIGKLVSSRRVSVKRITGEQDARGRRLLRIEFLVAPKPSPEHSESAGHMELRSGWLLVSPEEHWVLLGFATAVHRGHAPSVVQAGQIEYEERGNGIPTPRSVRTRTVSCDAIDIGQHRFEGFKGQVSQEEHFTISISRGESTPSGEFTTTFLVCPIVATRGEAYCETRCRAVVHRGIRRPCVMCDTQASGVRQTRNRS